MPYKDPEKAKEYRRKATLLWIKRHPERAKKSNKNTRLKREYGITLFDYEAKLADQGGVCAICGETNGSGHSLCVDHNHATKQVRGLLCSGCNSTIGHAKEDIPRLLAAIEYLKKWNRSE